MPLHSREKRNYQHHLLGRRQTAPEAFKFTVTAHSSPVHPQASSSQDHTALDTDSCIPRGRNAARLRNLAMWHNNTTVPHSGRMNLPDVPQSNIGLSKDCQCSAPLHTSKNKLQRAVNTCIAHCARIPVDFVWQGFTGFPFPLPSPPSPQFLMRSTSNWAKDTTFNCSSGHLVASC